MTLEGRGAEGVDALGEASDALDDAYHGVRIKSGKGAEHAREVASILRAAGYPESVEVAGLLHDVAEDTPWTIDDIRVQFGPYVAGLVDALTEDDGIGSYRRRKQALRDRIAAAGAPATDIALADKIASLRYMRISGRRLSQRKRTHYEATLATAGPTAQPGLAGEVAELLQALADRDGRDAAPPRGHERRAVNIQEMLEAHPKAPVGDPDAVARCVEACAECAATCVICADADLAEPDTADMVRCIRLGLDCADACVATGRIAARQTETDVVTLRAALVACSAACRACADECDRHADHHEHCRICARVCRSCEQACDALLATLG